MRKGRDDARSPHRNASMEPLPFRSGMVTSNAKGGAMADGFNGAAPFQERNALFVRVLIPSANRKLQWSRSLSGAE